MNLMTLLCPADARRTLLMRMIILTLTITTSSSGATELGRPDLSETEFERRMTARYGVLSGREPELGEGEIVLLERLAPMIQQNPEMVVSALTTLQLDGRPISPAFDQVLGNIYFGERAWDQAEEAYERAIAGFPDFQRAWNSLGALKMEQEEFAEAATALSKSIELGASDAHTYGLLGYALLQRQQYTAAEIAYDMALLREPDNIRWLEGKVRIISEAGRNAEAIAGATELLQHDPGNAQYWRLQANAYLALNDLTHTTRNLEIIRLLGDLDGDGLYLLGNLYLKQNMPSLAFNAYLAAMELEPASSPDLVIGVARTLLARKQFDLVSRLWDAAATQMDSWPKASQMERHLLQGQLAEHRKAWDQAISEYDKALNISPLQQESLFRLGRILHQQGQSARAQITLEKVKGELTYEYAAKLYLARLHIENERFEAALDPLRQAIRLRPGAEADNLYNQLRAALNLR